jgi:hypothetical protein
MQRSLKAIQVLLFIAISFLVLGFPAYFYICNLAGLDFRSPDLSLENPEQENTPINHHIYELKISGSNGWLDVLLLIKNIPKQPPLIGLPKPRLGQETIMLRC